MTPEETAEIVAFVKETIQDEGRAVTFYRFNKVAPDPLAPHKFNTDPFATATTQDAFAVFVSTGADFGFRTTKKALFNEAEAVALLEPIEGVDFSKFDAFTDETGKYTLTVTEVLRPASTPLLWAIGGVQVNAA